MKKILFGTVLAALVGAGVIFAGTHGPDTDGTTSVVRTASVVKTYTTPSGAANVDFETMGKKCNFQSDCKYGKCKRGRCGACDFQSDCRGWGKCKRGHCGGCDFQSDCSKKGFGSCRSGRCTKSPY